MLDFLIKIKAMVDVEKGVIQVRNGLGMVVEVLPFNVVNMLQRITQTKDACVKRLNKNFNNIQLERMATKGVEIISLQSTSLGFEDCNDDSMSDKEIEEIRRKGM